VEIFTDDLEQSINRNIPHKITKQKNKCPWISAEIKKLMKRRDRLYKKYRKSADQSHEKEYKDLKHTIQKKCRRKYWEYIEDVVTPTPESDGNCMKRFWSFIKHRKKDHNEIGSLRDNGILYTEPVKKANILNNQFKSAFTEKIEITKEEFEHSYMSTDKPNKTAPDINITCAGVERLLERLKPHKASGPDRIRPRILKELSSEVAPILTMIFNKSLATGQIPPSWRDANVTPIYKKGQKYKAENYRPISLTCVCCKIMEHIITSNIMSHAESSGIFHPLQHGFRKGRSCETQLIEFIDDITNNMEKNKQTDVLIMDFSKAFDKVCHSLLLHKLDFYGVRGKTNDWIKGFLNNRTQRVVAEGVESDIISVDSGVPQGSVLGPTLFLYYINDIASGSNSTIRLFADDTIAYLTIAKNTDCSTLQSDLDNLAKWEEKWKMSFHPDKCNIMTISKKRTNIVHDYSLHNQILKRVTSVKYLGCTINSDLNWSDHIQNITNKSNRTLGFLRRNLNISSVKIKEQAYKSLVRPMVEYASSAWDPYEKQHTQN
jgi:hypothetical protein